MTKKTKVSRDLLIISILTFITILTWVVMDVYRNLTQKQIPEVLEKQLLPLNSEIETKVFDQLENRLEEIPTVIPTEAIVEEKI